MTKALVVSTIALLSLSVTIEASPKEAVKPGNRTDVLFYKADWAAPCQQMQPSIQKLMKEGVPIRVIDYDEHKTQAKLHGISAIPTVIVFQDGDEVFRHTGAMTEKELRRQLENFDKVIAQAKRSRGMQEIQKEWPTISEGARKYPFPPIAMNPEQQSIFDELDEQTHVKVEGIPLSDVLRELSQRHGVPIVIDQVSIDNASLDIDETVDLDLDDATLRAMLKLLLEPRGLDFVVENQLLKILSHRDASRQFVTLGYRVPANVSMEKAQTSEQVAQLLRAMRKRTIETDPTVGLIGDKLIVVGTPEDHEHVQEVLSVLVKR